MLLHAIEPRFLMSTQQLEMLTQIRRRILSATAGISREEMLWIPPSFRNNILWNLGHLLVVQQIFHYRFAGQPLAVPEELLGFYGAGTSPGGWTADPDAELLFQLLEETPRTLASDYERGHFDNYQTFTTKSEIRVENIDHALAFNEFHEGLHTGVIECMRRLWREREA